MIRTEVEKEISLAAEPAGAEDGPDGLFDGLGSYFKKLAIQYPVSFLGLLKLGLRIEKEYRSTMFHVYIKNGHSTKLIFSSGSEDPPASKSPP